MIILYIIMDMLNIQTFHYFKKSAIDAIDNFRLENELESLCDDNKHPLIEKTMIGRFFDPRDKDPTTSTFDSGEEYWNLLYCIPKNVNQLIKV